MYTSYIGRKFLRLYAQKEGKSLSAKEFFETVQFPVFFGEPNHLMHVHGSTFFQAVSEKSLKPGDSAETFRLQRLQKDIAAGRKSGSTYVGYAAEGVMAVTSGQVSSLEQPVDEEEMYASWIGQALAVGVSGGYVMLCQEDDVLWTIFNGWRIYREYFRQTPGLKDKQIETWNGQSLYHAFTENYNPGDPFGGIRIDAETVLGKLAIPTIEWPKVIFALARKYPERVLTVYAYNLSQTNTTLGFINLYLPEVRKMFDLLDKVFLDSRELNLNSKQIEQLKPFFNFRNACALGTIGLKALEPDKLRTFMPIGSMPYAQGKEYKFSDAHSYQIFAIYKIWIYAMLDKKELRALAAEVAKSLHQREQPDDTSRGKTGASQAAKSFLKVKNPVVAVRELTKLIDNDQTHSETISKVVDEMLAMPVDRFPLFMALVGFEYSFQKQNNQINA